MSNIIESLETRQNVLEKNNTFVIMTANQMNNSGRQKGWVQNIPGESKRKNMRPY